MSNKKLRICIDLDGTICDIRQEGQTYADVKVKDGAAEKIRQLRAKGHTIILHTARNMGSTGHNVGKALKNVGKMTFEWLEKNGIEYDEIFFGKPNADITIDDRVIRFQDNWAEMTEEKLELIAKAK
ncbi:MAG: HAD hydrolase family protein [Acetobacter sp.]|nr:HAD hydrolase family protein [Acetobacter sp.]